MKNFLFLSLLTFTLLLSGCDKNKPLLFFSSYPITRETFSIDNADVNFKEGQRIYFVLFNPKPFTSNVLRIQILKIDRKAPYYSYNIVQGRDFEIDITENYVTDYFCLHEEGYYIVRIFSSDKFKYPIAEAHIQVDSR